MPLKRAVLEVAGCRRVLDSIGGSRRGRALLNLLDAPRGVFQNFEQASAAAVKARRGGHEHADAIADHLASADALKPSDYAVLFWLQKIGEPLRIFDFGGNVGNLYYSYQSYLAHLGGSDWTVYDLPEVVNAGRRLAVERAADRLHFVDQPALDLHTTVLLISGALHYWEQSIEALFDRLAFRPPHVLINRSPVQDQLPTFVTVQSHQRYAVPCLVRNSDEVISAFNRLGYVLVNRWHALELSIYIPLFPRWSVPRYSGFYFRRRDSICREPCGKP